MVITDPAVASARPLCLGSKLYPSNVPCMLKKPCQESGRCNSSYARYSEKRFTQIYKALYEDAMFVSLFRGTNMAAGNQQKHLSLSFPTYA